MTVYCVKGFNPKAGPGSGATPGRVLKRPASKVPDQVDETTPAEAAEPEVSEKPPKAAKAKSGKTKAKGKAKAKAKAKAKEATEEKVYEPNWYKAGNRWGIKVGKREACSVPRLP